MWLKGSAVNILFKLLFIKLNYSYLKILVVHLNNLTTSITVHIRIMLTKWFYLNQIHIIKNNKVLLISFTYRNSCFLNDVHMFIC